MISRFFSRLSGGLSARGIAGAVLFAVLLTALPTGLPVFGPSEASAASFSWNTVWDIASNPVGYLAKKAAGAAGSALQEAARMLLEFLGKLVYDACALFMLSMAWLLDFSLAKTIDSATLGSLLIVNTGWTIVRDISNMFFIFILLYIAIMTILGLMSHNTKTLLRNVILVALLINFSLFVTKVVIDAANVFAFSFYFKTETMIGGTPAYGPANVMLEGLKLQTTLSARSDDPSVQIKFDNIGDMLMVYIGGAILMLVAGYVFLVGAFMMIYRTLALIFCMIFSPFAFLGIILPKAGQITNKWWDTLIGNALVAPVFCFMIWLVAEIVRKGDLIRVSDVQRDTFSGLLTGKVDSFEIIYNYIILIGLMLGAIAVSKSVSGGAASFGTSWARKAPGYVIGGAAVAAGMAGRQLGGRIGKQSLENEKLQERAKQAGARGWMARQQIALASAASKGTWDLRNAPGVKSGAGMVGVNVGQASQKSFAKTGSGKLGGMVGMYRGEEGEAEILKIANERYKNNPEARARFLEEKLGSRYSSDAFKKTRADIGRDVARSDAKKNIKSHVEKEEKLKQDRAAGKITDEQAKIEGEAIASAIRDEIRKAGLNSSEKAELLEDKKYAESAAFIKSFTKQDLHAMSRRDEEGKYDHVAIAGADGKNVRLVDHVGQTILTAEGDHYHATQSYIMSDEGKKKLLGMDIDSYDDAVYERNARRIREAQAKRKQEKARLAAAEAEKKLSAKQAPDWTTTGAETPPAPGEKPATS